MASVRTKKKYLFWVEYDPTRESWQLPAITTFLDMAKKNINNQQGVKADYYLLPVHEKNKK